MYVTQNLCFCISLFSPQTRKCFAFSFTKVVFLIFLSFTKVGVVRYCMCHQIYKAVCVCVRVCVCVCVCVCVFCVGVWKIERN